MARTLIKNGTVVSPTGRHRVDVLIEGDTISALLEPGQVEALNITADKVIDATGKFVVPGGIDVHTHMELPFGGTNASDTFETGTNAAAWGGVTTIVDFAVQRYGENVQESLKTWHKKAEGNCSIDYAFHQIIGGIDDQALADMDYLVNNLKASHPSSCSWLTQAFSTVMTVKFCVQCSRQVATVPPS